VNSRIVNLCTRNTLFSRILDWKQLSFELVEFIYSKARATRDLALKDKLRNIKCENGDSMPKYLTKFTQCRDELGSVVVIVR